MWWFDPTYVIIVPGILLALWAQFKVQAAYARASRIRSWRGFSGAEIARRLLEANGIYDVGIGVSQGILSDHYDPRKKELNLSPDNFHGNSLAAIGVAAHETGHAIQHVRGYAPLALRSAAVPMAYGSNLTWLLVFLGFVMHLKPLIFLGILLFCGFVAFTLITLPVEFDASRRAVSELQRYGFVEGGEVREVKSVLNAAALTYVAAAAVAILQLVRLIAIANRRD